MKMMQTIINVISIITIRAILVYSDLHIGFKLLLFTIACYTIIITYNLLFRKEEQKKEEIRVYGITIYEREISQELCPHSPTFDEKLFIEESEKQGTVWELNNFIYDLNKDYIEQNDMYFIIKKN